MIIKQKAGFTSPVFFFVATFIFLLFSCSEAPGVLRKKLQVQLQDDLRFMVAEIESATGKKYLLEKPYYVIEDFREFQGDSARIFAAYAKVEFHYLFGASIVQIRKYRYNVTRRFWDRYSKKLTHSKH